MMQPKLGIIAGGGNLPSILIEQCEQQKRAFVIVALKGHAEPKIVANRPHLWVRLGAAGEAVKYLQDHNVSDLSLVGTVSKPSIADLRPDFWTAKFLAASGAYNKGDDGLLQALINHLEETEGFRVAGIDDLVPDLIAACECMTELSPSERDMTDIQVGIAAAKDQGRRDIGQGVVVSDGSILASEDRAGTDAMLSGLKPGDQRRGILVKMLKPGQERRADLPSIGPDTISIANSAGLRGVAVEAGSALIIDRENMIAAANASGMFVIGVQSTVANRVADAPLIYLIAGEPSADVIGGHLISALKAETDGMVQFAGVGGPEMAGQGFKSLFPMEELSVMGLAEVLPRIPKLRRRIHETISNATAASPDVLVTIDSPDFNFRVAKKLKGRGFPLIHFVAPSVWAWRPGRAKAIAGFLDHLLTLLPFEPPYFEREGLATTYVGHPVLESGADKGDGGRFRKKYGIAPAAHLVLILPGSRRSEVQRHLPIFGKTMELLQAELGNFHIVTVTARPSYDLVVAAAKAWSQPAIVIDDPADKFDAFDAADVALAASGTVALELAMSGTPAVIAYRTNPITAWLAKRLVKVRYANLINLVLDRAAVPEFLLDNCRADLIGPALVSLFSSAEKRESQRSAYADALEILGRGHEPASRRAALAVLDVARTHKSGAE